MEHARTREAELLAALGMADMPLGVGFTDAEPQFGYAPAPNEPDGAEESRPEKPNARRAPTFVCAMSRIRLARIKSAPAYFSALRTGCTGAAFYFGFAPYDENMARYISNVERYTDTVEQAAGMLRALDPPKAKARHLVFQPLSTFPQDAPPELVVFFARGEGLCGLKSLALFATGDMDVIQAPAFGPGCASVVTWPMKYARQGLERAIIGAMDPSCRPYFQTDELTFTVPYSLYEKMIASFTKSFLHTEDWRSVLRKMGRDGETS